MNRQELIERVRKLLALSQSPNEAEAEQAARRARDIVQRWNISASELERGEIGSDHIRTGRLHHQSWERRLLVCIAETHFCSVLTSKYAPVSDDLFGPHVKREAIYEIVGREPNRKAALELYRYLRETGLRLANETMRQRKNGWWKKKQVLDGYAIGIAKVLHDRNKNWSDFQEVNALVVTEQKANEDWIAGQYGNLRTAPSGRINWDSESFRTGYALAMSVQLNRQVNAGSTAALEVRK